jgi:hypothetical protein
LVDVAKPTVETRMNVPMNSTVTWRPSVAAGIGAACRPAEFEERSVREIGATDMN